jgi:hypothetical protein
MPTVDFTANNGTRLELKGYRIKNVEFIPEQELSSIESTETILDPNDGITVIGIRKNIVNTVTIKLIPNIKKVDETNAHEIRKTKKVHVEKSPRDSKTLGEGNTEKEVTEKGKEI